MNPPLWVIMVPTIPKRAAKFRALMAGDRGNLLGQVQSFGGEVRVLAWLNEGAPHLGAIRDAMVDEAAAMGATYVSFVDDDDQVDLDYVEAIMSALTREGSSVDHIGFRVKMTRNGEPYADVDHSLKHGPRWEALPQIVSRGCIRQFVRDFTHLDPIRTELAQRGSFALAPTGKMEDRNWVRQVRPFVKTEAYIDRVLYHYDWHPDESAWETRDSAKGGTVDLALNLRLSVSKHFTWHPESM